MRRERNRRGRGSRDDDKKKKSGGLFGRWKSKESAPKRGGRLDFGSLDDDDDTEVDYRRGRGRDRDDDDDRDDDRERRERRPRKKPRRERLTLMDLCTPVFAFSAMLPREPNDPQPQYRQFRDGVITALNRIESEASQHGIEAADVAQASYALCFFLDTQVASSSWNASSEWAGEPLGIVLQQDPEGGVNFFRRLEGFGERERGVKEVFLVCIALGFRGKFAELDPTEQSARLGEIRQQIVRSVRPESMEKLSELFPDAYQQADSIEDEVPKPPGWWLIASMAIVLVSMLAWFGMRMLAKGAPDTALDKVREVASEREDVRATAYETEPAVADVEDQP